MGNKRTIGQRIWELALKGYTPSEIARAVYGYDNHKYRHRVLERLRYYRRVFLSPPPPPPPPVAVGGGGDNYAHRIVSESVGDKGDYIATKIRYSRDRFVRQFMTHGELSPGSYLPSPGGEP